jgi:hypothetical protein
MRRIVPLLVLPLLFVAVAAFAGTGRAGVALANASATISQTSNTAWKLEKTGTLDSASSTVTWTITATQQATVSGKLFVTGFVAMTNSGAVGATVGNIVVNLQTKSGSDWETQSSDIADATNGDGATTAQIDPHASSEGQDSFTENAASGTLEFMDANSNTAFSLRPQVTIAPGATVNLLFAAEFDNTVLKLDTGTPVRAEVIVSFGNAGPGPSSASDVDINGNGTIDTDEAWVHSVPARLGLTVPAETASNDSITLTDTASDIATTGTATISNPTFDLATTSGTVTAQYSGGTDGGEITNCAHLKGTGSTVTVGSYSFPDIPGADLQACNTQTISASVITAGWKDGDLTTYTQDDWPGNPDLNPAGALLNTHYFDVYLSTGGLLTVGLPNTGYTMTFSQPSYISQYLPAVGPLGALDANLLNPSTSSSGGFGGDVLALQLNVDFSDSGFLEGTSNLKFGDLTLCNFTADPTLDGMTVRQILALANTALGGGTTGHSINDLDAAAGGLDSSFEAGTATTFAQQHVFNGACPVWKNGDFITYAQGAWGGDPTSSPAAATLVSDFNSVYAATFDALTVGLPGTGYTMSFTDAISIIEYLPAVGAVGTLDANTADPTTTSSGTYGGEVVALQLNVDFSDAGFTRGSGPVRLGDLTLCGISPAALDGTTVRRFLGIANTALGGGSTAYNLADLDTIAGDINLAFPIGVPSSFAQQHLVNGTCPAGP